MTMSKLAAEEMPAELAAWMTEQHRAYAAGSMSKENAEVGLLDARLESRTQLRARAEVLREEWLAAGWDSNENVDQ